MSAVATEARSHLWTQLSLLVTGVLGLVFLLLEGRDFAVMVAAGAAPQRSAFFHRSSLSLAAMGCMSARACYGWAR